MSTDRTSRIVTGTNKKLDADRWQALRIEGLRNAELLSSAFFVDHEKNAIQIRGYVMQRNSTIRAKAKLLRDMLRRSIIGSDSRRNLLLQGFKSIFLEAKRRLPTLAFSSSGFS
jgi:hypothetical protein